MHSSPIADAIVYVSQNELRDQAVHHLKTKGISNVVVPADTDECLESLKRIPKGLLVLEWALGQKDVVRILSTGSSGPGNPIDMEGDRRPVLLCADQVTPQVVATAAEYGVGQIYSLQGGTKNLTGKLTELLLREASGGDIRKIVKEVGKKRSMGDHKAAITLLEEARNNHPTSLRLVAELAVSHIIQDQWQKALDLLEPFVTKDNDATPYLRILNLYGRCLLRAKRTNEAYEVLSRAQLFNPHNSQRLVDVGNALLELDRPDEAAASFDAALNIDPKMREAKLGKSKCLLLDGDVNNALDLLREVSSPVEMASVFNSAAVLNIRRGRPSPGMQLYQAAMRAVGDNRAVQARLWFNMGLGYRRWGKADKAGPCFKKALDLDPAFDRAQKQIVLLSGKKPADLQQAVEGELSNAKGTNHELTPDANEMDSDKMEFDDSFDDFDDDLEEGLNYR